MHCISIYTYMVFKKYFNRPISATPVRRNSSAVGWRWLGTRRLTLQAVALPPPRWLGSCCPPVAELENGGKSPLQYFFSALKMHPKKSTSCESALANTEKFHRIDFEYIRLKLTPPSPPFPVGMQSEAIFNHRCSRYPLSGVPGLCSGAH